MSLANLVVQPQVAYLFTDSGGWRTNGELVELVRKEIILPHVPAAITAIGMVAPVFKIAAKRLTSTYRSR